MDTDAVRQQFETWLKGVGFGILGGDMRVLVQSTYETAYEAGRLAGLEEAANLKETRLINLAAELAEWIENHEIGCCLSDEALRYIRDAVAEAGRDYASQRVASLEKQVAALQERIVSYEYPAQNPDDGPYVLVPARKVPALEKQVEGLRAALTKMLQYVEMLHAQDAACGISKCECIIANDYRRAEALATQVPTAPQKEKV